MNSSPNAIEIEGYPSQSAAVRALYIQGHRPNVIARHLGISSNSVNRAICDYRKKLSKPSNWSEDDVSMVKQLWTEGKTSYEIVTAICGRHSRSAVMGLIYRSGLSRTGKRPQPKPEPVKKAIVQVQPQEQPEDDGLSWRYIDSPQNPIWSMDEERRRLAFTRRAAEGARKALEAIEA